MRPHDGHARPASGERRWPTIVAWAVATAYTGLVALGLWLGARSHAVHAPADVGLVGWNAVNGTVLGVFATFVLTGAVIVSRRPGNRVGWVMLAGGTAFGLSVCADIYALLAIGGAADELPTLGVALRAAFGVGSRLGAVLVLILLPLLYPDGRLPSPRWRTPAKVVGAYVAVWIASTALAPRLTGFAYPLGHEPIEVYDVANPLAVAALEPVARVLTGVVEGPLILALAGVAVAGVVVRFRRSQGIERQQMKWFTFAAGVYVTLLGLSITANLLDVPEVVLQTSQGLAYVSLVAFPAAIGIAVLRHRLYEIDRIISRTVSYGLVVAILAAVYAGAVVALGAAVSAATGGGDSDLVVAASTLLAAGLFRPVRTRVQTVVDRRFNRTGYDARQAVETFARDVRDEVDRDRLRRRTAEAAATAVEPTHVSLWLAQERPEQ